jgi:Lrp/AsnC family transcriptional regulator, regulator of ectoine-degradation genes
MQLDGADIRILCAILAHGELTKSKLAELVGLSPTPCWARFQRMRKAGLITGFHGEIALSKIVNFSKVIVTISLHSHRKQDFTRFEAYVDKCPEIIDCVATGGGMDYVLTILSPNLQSFQALMETMLEADLAIDRYMTYIVTRQIKATKPDLAGLMAQK